MKNLGLTSRMFLSLVLLDVTFLPILAAELSAIVGLSYWPTLIILGVLSIVRLGVLWPTLRHLLGPTEALQHRAKAGRVVREGELNLADARLQRVPMAVALINGGVTCATHVATVLLHHVLVGPPDLRVLEFPVVALVAVAGITAALAVTPGQILLMVSEVSRANDQLARTLDIDLERAERLVGGRLTTVALGLTLTPVLVLTSVALAQQDRAAYDRAERDARALSAEVTLAPDQALAAEARAGTIPFMVRKGELQVPQRAGLPGWATVEALTLAADGELSPPDRHVAVTARRLDDGRIVGAIVAMEAIDSGFVILLAIVLALLGAFGPMAASMFSRALTGPLSDIADFAGRIVERGDLSEMGYVSSAVNDEVGIVSNRFNQLIDSMRSIAAGAQEVGEGKLTAEIEGTGELPDSFRAMLEQLRSLVGEMRGASTELASAAAEISAASQEQEAAATSHSTGMTEISQTMDSLSGSASHVAKSVQGVLENAERTLQNTDQMVSRIDELTGQANRIGDILDVIKDIADRTDLLALNGSLEASRAGEAGVGFSLVAAEMRRLAERVTASVGDIKQLVSDIRESGASTVVATEESKKLAQGTTEAARSITLVTQQQQSSTEQVSQNVRTVAEVVQQSANATVQTRTSADGLKQQADRLAELVGRFELEPRAAE